MIQSIALDAAWWAQITGSQRGWDPPSADRPAIDPGLALNGATDRLLEAFGVYSSGVVRLSIDNGDLTDAFEDNGGVRLTVGSQSWIFLLAGADMSVPYFWAPSNSAEVIEVHGLISSATAGTLEISDDPDTDFSGMTAAPVFADDGDAQTWVVGTAIANITVPAASGTPAPTYAVVGSLPAGLAFDTSTRVLSGTPTETGSGTITIRATNSQGSDDWTAAYTTVAATTLLVLADSDDTGLDVDAKALLVASAPGTAGSDPYVDSDRGGTDTPLDGELGLSSTNTVISRFRRLVAAELTLNDNDSPAALDIGVYFNAGGDGADLTIYLQTLDGEVSFTAAAQFILGGGGFARFNLPADAQTLLNNLGTGDRWIFKAARPSSATEAPSFSDDTGDVISGVVGTAITSVTVPAASGNPTPTYAAVGTLPAGIAFNTTTRVLSGTPTGTASGTITIRATNGEGSDDWTAAYTFSASSSAPAFTDDTGDAQTWAVGTAIAPVQVPAATGNPTPTYAVVGGLPAGIAFATSTRRITGTPTGSGSGTIRIRATNSEGSDDWTVAYTTLAGVWSGGAVTFAQAVGGDAVDMGLDEWGVFAGGLTDAQMADLPDRARHHRVFGGYVFGVVDHTDPGPRDQHVYDLSLAGYGLRLDKTFVRELYASATGSSVRVIAADVLSKAGIADVFNSNGVTLNDIVDRAVYPVLGVMDILRQLADGHGAIVTVDNWREIDMVRQTALTHSPLRLHRTGKVGNLRSLGRSTEPRHYANRSIVVGRGETGTIQDERTGDGATRQWDLSQVPEEVLEVTLAGVNEEFEGSGAMWTIDQDAARITRASGESTPGVGVAIKIAYVSREAIVITTDDAAAITDIGFTVARKLEDDAIDTPGLARVRGAAFLDRHNELSEHFVAETIPGSVSHIVAGVAPTCDFPRYGLNGVRLLVEAVSSALGRSGDRFHAVVHRLKLTAQDYQGDAGDDWRQYQLTRPPAPRPTVPGTVDPNQEIIRPDNVAVPASLPIHLGGAPGGPVTSSTWAIPPGAVIERVSGHQIAIPLALQFMAQCTPTPGTSLASNQTLEVRLWDNTLGAAIGSAVVVDETVIDRYILRSIILPLREFDVVFQARVTGGLRGGLLWGVRLKLDI